MALPNFQKMMYPALECYADGKELRPRDVEDKVANMLKIPQEEREELIPSQMETVLRNRVSWAIFDLFQAGLLARVKRGFYKITEQGLKELKETKELSRDYLSKYPSFVAFQNRKHVSNKEEKENTDANSTTQEDPMTTIGNAFDELNERLEIELLDTLKSVEPVHFERILLNLFDKMGYGETFETKKSHDGGIDGIINEDELGLEKIYIQAKRYGENKVHEKEMRDFVGALGCSTVRKGIFITTSIFDKRAENLARNAQGKIIHLIDGEELSKLLIKHNVGVRKKQTYEIKEIDNEYLLDE